jgi:hypothetical protein
MALLSIPPWSELYDVTKNDIVTTTSNTALNGKLYVKIISVLEGQALQDVISRSHLRANGLLLLQEMVQMYKPTNVPEVLAAKAGEFWSKMKRSQGESVDSYYNRFRELLDDLDQEVNLRLSKTITALVIFLLNGIRRIGHHFSFFAEIIITPSILKELLPMIKILPWMLTPNVWPSRKR